MAPDWPTMAMGPTWSVSSRNGEAKVAMPRGARSACRAGATVGRGAAVTVQEYSAGLMVNSAA